MQLWIDLAAVSAIQTWRRGNGDLDPTVQEQWTTSKHCDWWPVLQWRVRRWLRPCPLPDPEAYDVSVGEAEDGISSYMLWIASKLQVGGDRGMDMLALVLNKTLAEILTLGGKCIGTMLKKPATLGYHLCGFMFLVFWWKMLIHVLRWML